MSSANFFLFFRTFEFNLDDFELPEIPIDIHTSDNADGHVEATDTALLSINAIEDRIESRIFASNIFVSRSAGCRLNPEVKYLNRQCLHTSQIKQFIEEKNRQWKDDEIMLCVTPTTAYHPL